MRWLSGSSSRPLVLYAGGGRCARRRARQAVQNCPDPRNESRDAPGRARWPGALASRGVTHRPPPGALATRPTALLGTCWTDRSSADAEAGAGAEAAVSRAYASNLQSAQKRFVPMHSRAAIANNASGVDEEDRPADRPVFLTRRRARRPAPRDRGGAETSTPAVPGSVDGHPGSQIDPRTAALQA